MALSRRRIEQQWIARGGNPQFARAMARIALRETSGKPHINNAHSGPGGGKLNSNGTVDWGLYGVNDVWRKDPVIGRLFRSGRILTPAGATDAAIRILRVQGPHAWATGDPAVDHHYLSGLRGGAAARRGGLRGSRAAASSFRPSGAAGGGSAAALLALTRQPAALPAPSASLVAPAQPDTELVRRLLGRG